MAEVLFEKIKPVLGKQILDIITSGMYDNPLSIYREYIQNAADSFDSSFLNDIAQRDQAIRILIDGKNRNIIIEDNGPGVPSENVPTRLLNIGCSNKLGTTSRGFRGIGRLGGLGYCKRLVMETKAASEKEATVIIWDGELLRELIVQTSPEFDAVKLVKRVCSIHKKGAYGRYDEGYFKITMEDVNKFHGDELLNVKSIRKYVSKTTPVPYDGNFSFSKAIENHIASVQNYGHYKVLLNGEQIFKPYNNIVTLSGSKEDQIQDVVLFTFRDNIGDDLAHGWYGKLGHFSSIPISCNCRGILIRAGNIAVGDEYFLSEYYSERRFATWHVGEIFLVNGKMKPNARRDGFEQNSYYESFCEQATILGQHLSKVVREASKLRSAEQRVVVKIEAIEKMMGNGSVFLDQEEFNLHLDHIKAEIVELEEIFSTNEFLNGLDKRLKKVQLKLHGFTSNNRLIKNHLDGRRLRKVNKKEIIENICKSIKQNYDETNSAEELMAKVLFPYGKGD